MTPASELRPGMAVRLEGTLYKVIAAESHGVGGKLGTVTHAKLRNLRTGAMREWRFRADELVETLEPERQVMQFLYSDGEAAHFMNPETFEQVAIELARLGRRAAFLADGMTVPVEFVEGQPVGVTLPDVVEVRVASTAPPSHTQGADNVWKEARLENGLTVMVPPFIAPGEVIRVDVESGAYVERAKRRGS
ncbi:MAG TPA: elongation factor P [Vicinamibacterales bacterium]|jgi:elongation factor P|nr:elongation factor P [Vicinamibacterales bacterium]